jgi:hypothetical protein
LKFYQAAEKELRPGRQVHLVTRAATYRGKVERVEEDFIVINKRGARLFLSDQIELIGFILEPEK